MHNLEIINGKAQMFSVQKVPWHKLGTILDNPPTSKEAIVAAGLNWDVVPTDIFYKINDNYAQFEGKKALVRNTDNNPLSIVSDHYKPLQNSIAFEWFDPIVQEGKATYETAGSLQGGKKIWIMAKLNDDMDIIPGDTIQRYLLLANGHDGITGIMIQPTPIRVVCENTLNASLATGNINSIWHHGDIKEKMEKVKRLLGLADKEFEYRKEVYKAMAKFQVNDEKSETYVKTILPDPNKEATDRVKANLDNARNTVKKLHECGMGSKIPGVRGSMWGMYNAAVEYAEYYMPQKVRDLASYELWGLGANFKQKAYDTATEMMKV